jgi:23S rRNA (cytosine1962-C5)-methyltransferase
LIYSESDGLPGLIVDRYANFAAVQFLSAGAELHRHTIAECLLELPFIDGIYERSDASVRRKENLPERCGYLAGQTIPGKIIIRENGLSFEVDLLNGQKTGFYFDLRTARQEIRRFASGKRVLNMFSYTGGFACAALAGGAKSVFSVDSSAPALEQSKRNLSLNNFEQNHQHRCGDVFEILRELDRNGEKFDLIILDPPKLIPHKGAMLRGCRAYQDLARLGYKLLAPGGTLCNFSCSGAMESTLFQKITADGAIEAGVNARIVARLEQSPDHPTLLSVPETFYLKGLITIID